MLRGIICFLMKYNMIEEIGYDDLLILYGLFYGTSLLFCCELDLIIKYIQILLELTFLIVFKFAYSKRLF